MLLGLITLCLLAFASSSPCGDEASRDQLLLSLNKDLLRSVESQQGLPNPSVHLALRISKYHNLVKEGEHLAKLKTQLHNDLQTSLSNSQSVVGLLALYALALKASCHDLDSVTFTTGDKSEMLLTHLKRQMEEEKEHVAQTSSPLSNYYQYSLGVLALCTNGNRVNHHVANKLIHAVERKQFKHGDTESIDTYAMAAMALQCVKEAGFHSHGANKLHSALTKIKHTFLAARRPDGHIGNEFSTGLAVQALLAMGTPVSQCAASMEALRTDARSNTYHNPMALSQILPALEHKSYLTVRNMLCVNEDDTLVLEPVDPVVVLPSDLLLALMVEVVSSTGASALYHVDVPKGSSLLEALELLKGKNPGFMFETESSMWGPFLSIVNGEKASQSDRGYWNLSSDGTALSQGISDYKIEAAQRITIKYATY